MIGISEFITEKSSSKQYTISEDSMEIIVHALSMLKKKGTIFKPEEIDRCLEELKNQ